MDKLKQVFFEKAAFAVRRARMYTEEYGEHDDYAIDARMSYNRYKNILKEADCLEEFENWLITYDGLK